MKNWPKGGMASHDLLFQFWDTHPLISLEWLKIQISNFARRMKVMDTKQKTEK